MTAITARIAALAALLIIGSCSDSQHDQYVKADPAQIAYAGRGNYIDGWDDPQTGCKYFYSSTYAGYRVITPRFWSNGQPMCPDNKPQDTGK